MLVKASPTGPEFSPKPSTSPPHLGSPGRKPPKSPPERKPAPLILDGKKERNQVRDTLVRSLSELFSL